MKKVLILLGACIISANAYAAMNVYGNSMKMAQTYAQTKCNQGYQFVENIVDATGYFQCANGMAYSLYCRDWPHIAGSGVFDIPVPRLFWNNDAVFCDWFPNGEDMMEKYLEGKIPNCETSMDCSCRDNPDQTKLFGDCRCGGLFDGDAGLFMDYSSCSDTPPDCDGMEDVNGVERGSFDTDVWECVIGPEYTFNDGKGNYNFTSKCVFSR